MEVKKTPKASLENKRLLMTEAGLVIALGIVYGAFNYSSKDAQVAALEDTTQVLVEEEMIAIQNELPPPPPEAPSIPVLSVTKGLINLEDGTLISYPEYWKRELAKKGIRREICAIGGPCTSYELVFHDQTEVAFCGKDSATIRMMKETMQTSYYHISLTNDVEGLESAVALKNGYALAIAMTIGLVNRHHGPDAGLHFNSQAAAFYQAVKEMRYLLEMQGASRDCENIGIGDLYVTVYGGRTRKVGILLGEGKTYQEAMEILAGVTLESLVVSRRVYKAMARKAELGLADLKQFPMLCHAAAVLDEGRDAELPWEAFTFDQTN